MSIVIGVGLGQHLKSLVKLPIDSPAHFGPSRVVGADDQQPARRQGFENVSYRDRQLLRIEIGSIQNVHSPHDIHSTRQGVRLQEIVLQQTESTIACGKLSRCRAEQYQRQWLDLASAIFCECPRKHYSASKQKEGIIDWVEQEVLWFDQIEYERRHDDLDRLPFFVERHNAPAP